VPARPLCDIRGRQGDVIYLPQMRTQIIAARTVAEALAAMATSPEAEFGAAPAAESAGAPVPELAGPREENLASLARLVAARRGDQVRIEEVKAAAGYWLIVHRALR
jgi:hypothetical protein